MKTNVQLQQDVIDELQYEPSVNASELGDRQGWNRYSHRRPEELCEKWSATRATERVSGVKAVVDEIKVDLPFAHERGDADIAKAALQALEWNVQVSHTRLIVKVEQGKLTTSKRPHWTHFAIYAA